MASADLLLHPVRLRIVKAFLGDRALTTAQLAGELADVPAGSIYRHVAVLTRAGVLQVVAERRVRGAVERTYTLRLLAAQIQPDEAAAMTLDQHAQAFMAYIAGLLADFDRYLAAGPPDLVRDGTNYQVAAMWLTDAEFTDFVRDLVAIARPRLANAPGPGRRRRMLYSVLLPAPAPPGAAGGHQRAGADGSRPRTRTGRPQPEKRRSKAHGEQPGAHEERPKASRDRNP